MSPLSRRQVLARSLLLAPALALPNLLAACTKTSEDSAGTGASTSDAKKVTTQILVGFGTGNAPAQVPAQVDLAKAFEATTPGSSVEFLRIPDTDEAQRKFGVLLASGDAPDVVLPTGLFGISLYLDQNVWLDLSALMSASGISLDLFEPGVRDAARGVNYFGAGSKKVIGIPAGIFTHAVAYNKDLFAKAGLAEPPHEWDTPDWNYDKLVEVASALTLDDKGRTPTQPGFDPTNIKQFGLGHWDTGVMTLGHGGKAYEPGAKKLSLDSPEYIAGVQAGADLVNKHHVLASDELAAGVAAGADDPQLAAWKSGKVAMIDMCACDLLSFGVDNSFQWDVAAWPRGPKRLISHLNVDFGSVVAKSKGQAQAWELLRFLLVNPQNGRTLSSKGYGAMSPLRSETGTFVDELKGRFPDVDLSVFVKALPYSANEQEVWYPAFTEIGDMGSQFLDTVKQGKSTAAEQLPKYQEAAQKKFDEWFKTHTLPTA